MTIYIESFVIQNVLINLCLLRLIKVTLKQKTTIFKLIFASIIGAGFSVISAIYLKNYIALNIIKFLCAIIMLKCAFKLNYKQLIYNFILLFIFTYAFGGAVTSLSGASYYTNFGVIISSKISLEAVSLLIILVTYAFELVTKQIKFKIKSNSLIYPIKLYLNNKKIAINAYLDTGNLLKYNGEPVVIVDIHSYLKLANETYINFLLKKGETISLNTVAGRNNLKLFKIDKMEIKINHKTLSFTHQYIAVNEHGNFKNTNYQALLTPALL